MCGGNQVIRPPRVAGTAAADRTASVPPQVGSGAGAGQNNAVQGWHTPLQIGQGQRINYMMGQPGRAPPGVGPQQQSGETQQVGDTHPDVQHSPTFLPLNDSAVGFDATRPWIARAQPGVDNSSVSLELYGLDISEAEAGPTNAPVIQNFLQSHQQVAFRRQMDARLNVDLEATKTQLISGGLLNRYRTTETLRFWANARDYTDATGTSYFDRFLDALDEGTISVTHSRHVPFFPSLGVETGHSEKSYLDDLYGDSGGYTGDVIGMVASNSVKHGGYRPAWHQLQRVTNGQGPDVSQTPDALVNRGVNAVLDRLAGPTSSAESATMRDVLTGLPPPDQARVLQGIMSRHGDTIIGSSSFGIGRFGEPTPQDMLHYLMENFDDDHRAEVFASLESSGTITPEGIAGLRQGRTLAGQYLPVTTHLGANAAQFWADEYIQNDSKFALVMGAFASLWTPETATTTALTLATAGLGSVVSGAPKWVQQTLAIVGTAPTSYQLTQSLIEIGTGRDIYTNEPLNETEIWTRGILAVSNAMFLGTGFYGLHQMGRAGPVAADAPDMLPARTSGARALGAGAADDMMIPGGSGGRGRSDTRILGVDEAGNVSVMGRDPMTGDIAYMKINQITGDGFVVLPRQGMIPIRGGQPVARRPALAAADVQAPTTANPQTQPAAPEVLTGAGRPPGQRMLPGRREPRQLTAGEPQQETLADIIPEVFGPVAAETPRLIMTPRGRFMTELPPLNDDIPIYWGDIPHSQVPDIHLGQRPTAVGPVPEGLTFHEIFPSAPTTQTVNQMRHAPSGTVRRGAVQGEQLEIFVQEGAGPFAIRNSGGIRDPITNKLRYHDVRQPTYNGRTFAFEAKNYLRWLSPKGGGVPALREVPLSNAIRQQVNGDAFMMIYGRGNYRPVWVFGHAPPSADLANYLRLARIPYVVYGDMLVP